MTNAGQLMQAGYDYRRNRSATATPAQVPVERDPRGAPARNVAAQRAKPAPKSSGYRILRTFEGARRKRPPSISLVTVGLLAEMSLTPGGGAAEPAASVARRAALRLLS